MMNEQSAFQGWICMPATWRCVRSMLLLSSLCVIALVGPHFCSAAEPVISLSPATPPTASPFRGLLPVPLPVANVLERRRHDAVPATNFNPGARFEEGIHSSGILPARRGGVDPAALAAMASSGVPADQSGSGFAATRTPEGFLSMLTAPLATGIPTANNFLVPDLMGYTNGQTSSSVMPLAAPLPGMPSPLDYEALIASMAASPLAAGFPAIEMPQSLNPTALATTLPSLPPLLFPLTGTGEVPETLDKEIEEVVGQPGSIVRSAGMDGWKNVIDDTIRQTNEVLNMHGLPPLQDPRASANRSHPLSHTLLEAIGMILLDVDNQHEARPETLDKLLQAGLVSPEDVQSFMLPPVRIHETNEGLTKSAWSISHRTGFSQASSPFYGPDGRQRMTHSMLNRVAATQNPINLLYTEDHKYLWGASWTSVFKVDRSGDSLRLVDYVVKPFDDIFADKFHGAYSMLTSEGVFLMAIGTRLDAFYDAPGSGGETILKHPTSYDMKKNFPVTHPHPLRDSELIRALCMSSDGHIVFGTTAGRIGVLSRFLDQGFSLALDDILLGQGSTAPLEVSNNIACDDNGNVYVVSSEFMHKVHWNGTALSVVWETPYGSNAASTESVRLGAGSGSTPSLMGQSPDNLYVVISDATEVMNVLVFDANVGDIVATHPITFGDPNATKTSSEQSLLVHGWRIVVVNNTPDERLARGPPLMQLGSSAARLMGNPDFGMLPFRFITALQRRHPGNGYWHHSAS
eukprot:GHVT01067257.1.p1 GENE.GHVT01067257.1~~GHVT01067257.1.p1  ORF type:complete len:746 (-),score=99.42 GHVT01067257.1:301-2538(-)